MKFEYQITRLDTRIWVSVLYKNVKDKKGWSMTITRNLDTLIMEPPEFWHAKEEGAMYTKIDKGAVPKYVRINFDCVMNKAKTMLILESDK